jgi:hypothetical protein
MAEARDLGQNHSLGAARYNQERPATGSREPPGTMVCLDRHWGIFSRIKARRGLIFCKGFPRE